jgi:hypothetical protein
VTACLSDYAVDRVVAGEPRAESAAHASGCETCTARIAERRGEQQAFRRDAPPLPLSRPTLRQPKRAWLAVPTLAVAAAVTILLLRPPTTSTRTKGAGQAAAYVKHDGAVRRAVHAEVVAAGDSVQLVTTLTEPSQVAVLGVDGAGAVTVYRRAATQRAGAEVPLDFSIVLDAVRGEERIFVLYCDGEALDAYAQALAHGGATPPSGCRVDTLVLVVP